MLSETWSDNDERVLIPNFDCCVQFKRPGRRAAGVAIYRKQKNSHVVTPQMNITCRQQVDWVVLVTILEDICAAECSFENGQTVILVVTYIS
ncbi:hypothetical protein TNCV_1969641 [Trichonephila clavipes]|nr:hypothetical protein TNCV_1969641 [Trichonephila clavipes]